MISKIYRIIGVVMLLPLMAIGQPNEINIEVQGNIAFPDTLILHLWNDLISFDERELDSDRVVFTALKNNEGAFKFTIPSNQKYQYVALGWEFNDHGFMKGLTQRFLTLVEKDDDVIIYIEKLDGEIHASYRGKGSEKYNCVQELEYSYDDLYDEWEKNELGKYPNETLVERLDKLGSMSEFIILRQLNILEKYKRSISPSAYSILKLDILSRELQNLNRDVNSSIMASFSAARVIDLEDDANKSIIVDFLKKENNILDSMADSVLVTSAIYTQSQLKLVSNLAKLQNRSIIDIILTQYDNKIKEKILTCFFLNDSHRFASDERENIYQVLTDEIRTKSYGEAIRKKNNGTTAGKKVLDIGLLNSADELINLSSFRGKVIFIDFWYVGCAGCAGYYKMILSPVEEIFESNKEVVFITISIDKNKEQWLKGISNGRYTSENSKNVVNLRTINGVNDALIKQFGVISYPHPLLIGKDGKVFSNSNKELRHQGVTSLVNKIQDALEQKL